jgi:murein DD-endopeptidase MepM/ murein hydrolase activator NlpD
VFSIDEGTVIEAVCIHKDNPPGKPDYLNPAGNYIVIKHHPDVFSFYGHLREKSIKVKKGESVKALQVIAELGNSGYSTMPHLHFQLSRGALPLEDVSIPFMFKNTGWPR